METDLHRVIRTQELSDDHCQYFIYQVQYLTNTALLFKGLLTFWSTDTASDQGLAFC